MSDHYHFVPVGIVTYGAYGPQGVKLVKQSGKKIQDATISGKILHCGSSVVNVINGRVPAHLVVQAYLMLDAHLW